ncbi:hypothetical protein M1O13_01520 [Dehalococcoidia bacterium]|nr:hypothetical protein [Dehalococcoidia bacterium]
MRSNGQPKGQAKTVGSSLPKKAGASEMSGTYYRMRAGQWRYRVGMFVMEYRGVIRGWQGGWSDLSDFRDSSESPFFELILTKQQYDELKKNLAMDLECDDIIYGAVYGKEGIVLRACGVDMKALANCLAFKIKEQGNFNRRILRQVQTGIQTLLGQYNSG